LYFSHLTIYEIAVAVGEMERRASRVFRSVTYETWNLAFNRRLFWLFFTVLVAFAISDDVLAYGFSVPNPVALARWLEDVNAVVGVLLILLGGQVVAGYAAFVYAIWSFTRAAT